MEEEGSSSRGGVGGRWGSVGEGGELVVGGGGEGVGRTPNHTLSRKPHPLIII